MFPLPSIAPDGSGTSQFRENWLPFFCRAGREVVDVGEFVHEIGWVAAKVRGGALACLERTDAF